MTSCQTVPTHRVPADTETTSVPFKAFYVFSSNHPRDTHYVPSGYMGDNDLTLSGAYIKNPAGAEGTCLRANYKASGVQGWSGLYWQDPPNNWATAPGRAGYDLRGARKLVFWARGEHGGEKVQQFRIGGIAGGMYPDSDVSTLGPVKLSSEWKEYAIDLKNKDLRHIIGGFGFNVLKADNPGGATFYLSDIVYVGAEGLPLTETSSSSPIPAIEATSAAEAVTLPAVKEPKPPASEFSSKDLEVKQTEAGLKVSFSSRFLFTAGRSNLLPTSYKYLDQLVQLLGTYPNNNVLIEGHTDSTGKADYNVTLSRLRAVNVRNYLMTKTGFPSERFQVEGYGATRPVADNNTAAGKALNRRVEVTILKSAPQSSSSSSGPVP